MQFCLREYHCDIMHEEIAAGFDRDGINVHCPYFNYNANPYSLEVDCVCSADFPNNQGCIVLELMIKEAMKERSELLAK